MSKERILTPRFKRNQKVIVVNGFERDNQGVVTDVRHYDIRATENEYWVYFGFLKPSKWIRESYLEAL